MSGFDDLARLDRRNGCQGCGEPSAGVINFAIREYGPKPHGRSPLKGGRTVHSRSLAFCEGCAVERYALIQDIAMKPKEEL